LANIACAEGFAQRLQGQQVACMSFHPGLLATGIWPQQTPLQKVLVPLLKALYFASPEKGARALAQLCCDVDYNEGRGYFRGNKSAPPPHGFSPEFGRRLWQKSLALCADYLPPATASA
jgi:NAD(P)-dependent dehydrogenase (short-subunit alcohol dehydrogenase family)